MPETPDTYKNNVITDREELAEQIRELVGNPLSVWAVAATIESLGIRDIDAHQEFGYSSVFELAHHVYNDIKQQIQFEAENEERKATDFEKPPRGERFWRFLKYYSQGLLFSLPMISQIIAVILFRYSLWAWLEFNEAQATIVAFGTILAFVVTGGFTQTLGRSVTKYMSETNYLLAFDATKKIMKGGVITTAIVAVLFYVLNIIIPFYPQGMLFLGLIYYVLISLLILASGVLYALEQRLTILLIIISGTAVVIFGMDVLNIGIYLSHWIGMGITIVLLGGYGYLYLRIKVRVLRQNLVKQSLPNTEVRYYINYRYFIYGFCYFLFLFLDRILAWSAGPPPPAFIMWFNTPYELGMDWALISMVITIAVLEYSVQAFSYQLMPLQKKAGFRSLKKFNQYFRGFYQRQVFLVFVFGIISIVLTFYSINSLRLFGDDVPEIRDFFANPMTTRVFWMASVSYLFMIIGLLHSLFFFTLNKPAFAMYSIMGGVAVNFVVGYTCSRVLGLEYAALGLGAGALAFAIISGLIAKSFFKHLDYYYYSAF